MPSCSCCRGQCTYPSSSASSSCTSSPPKKTTPSSGIPRSNGARECVRDTEEEWDREEEEAEGGGGGEQYGSSVLSSSSSSSSPATRLSSPTALSSSTRSPTAPAPAAYNKADPAPSAAADRRGFGLSFSLLSAPTPNACKLDVRCGTIASRTPASLQLVFRPSTGSAPSAISCGSRRLHRRQRERMLERRAGLVGCPRLVCVFSGIGIGIGIAIALDAGIGGHLSTTRLAGLGFSGIGIGIAIALDAGIGGTSALLALAGLAVNTSVSRSQGSNGRPALTRPLRTLCGAATFIWARVCSEGSEGRGLDSGFWYTGVAVVCAWVCETAHVETGGGTRGGSVGGSAEGDASGEVGDERETGSGAGAAGRGPWVRSSKGSSSSRKESSSVVWMVKDRGRVLNLVSLGWSRSNMAWMDRHRFFMCLLQGRGCRVRDQGWMAVSI
ncbi:hypothetical protein B0H14DRAFT_2944733 [Mycena olivaceomarginata]|nr:hypothetical protein B0H14DRAFT_2944733 [Mycena olivaceomarginata]